MTDASDVSTGLAVAPINAVLHKGGTIYLDTAECYAYVIITQDANGTIGYETNTALSHDDTAEILADIVTHYATTPRWDGEGDGIVGPPQTTD